jgi:hypothetical protein
VFDAWQRNVCDGVVERADKEREATGEQDQIAML